jgi:phage repressor protein C with HTH and peptisase S24 domain
MSDDQVTTRMQDPSSIIELGRRITSVLDLIGTRRISAAIARRSTDMLNKYERGASEPPFVAMAALCKAAAVRMEWLATGEGEMHDTAAKPASDSASQPVRHETLTMALQLAAEALGEKELPPAKHAELVALIYELLEEGLPEAKVLRFARAAAA